MFFDDNATIIKNAEEVLPRFSDKSFKSHFRMSPEVFKILCNEIHLISIKHYGIERNRFEIKKQLMITLWYLGSQECIRTIGDRFGVAISNVLEIIRWNCDILLELNRQNKYCNWHTSESAEKTSQYYFNKYRIPGIIGSIDWSHIPIRKPMKSANSYINKEGFHSVLLQGICNHNLEFIFCNIGDVGSMHHALLLKTSPLIHKVDSGEYYISPEQHILGDSTYPLKEWLITPYEDFGQLDDRQKIFNQAHSKCRVSIKRAFELLKCRFRRLFYIDCQKPSSIVMYIMASCILHNICLQNNDMVEEYNINVTDNEEIESSDEFVEPKSQSKRNNLMNLLF